MSWMSQSFNYDDLISKRKPLDSRHISFANNSDNSPRYEDSKPKYLRVFVGDSFSYLHPVTTSSTQSVKWLAFAALHRYTSTTSAGGTVRLRGGLGSRGSVLPEDVIDEATGKIIPPSETLAGLVKYLSSNNPDLLTFPIRVRLMSSANTRNTPSPRKSKANIRNVASGHTLDFSSPSRSPQIRSPHNRTPQSPTLYSQTPRSSRLTTAGAQLIHTPTTPSRVHTSGITRSPISIRHGLQSPLVTSSSSTSISSSRSGSSASPGNTTSPATTRSLWQACAYNMSPHARDAAINLATQTRTSEKQMIASMRAKAEASYAREMVSQVLSLNDYLVSVGDNDLVVAHALEQEWEFVRVHMLVSSPGDIRIIKSTMLRCWSSLNELYRHFSASELEVDEEEDDTTQTMQLDEFIQFALVSGLSPLLNRATLETIFLRANANRDGDADIGGYDGDDDSMTRYEWLESLILLAEAAFASDLDSFTGQRIGIARAFEKLCTERLVPLAEQLGAAPLRQVLRSKPMLVWLSSRLEALKAVFAYYSVFDAKDTERILQVVSEQFGVDLAHDVTDKFVESSPQTPTKAPVSNTATRTVIPMEPHAMPVAHSTTDEATSHRSVGQRMTMGNDLVFRFCTDGRNSQATSQRARRVDHSSLDASFTRLQAMNYDRFAASMVHAGLAPSYVLSKNDLDAGAINIAEEIRELTGRRPHPVLPLTVPVPGELTGRELRRAFNGSQAEDDGSGLDKEEADDEMVFAEWLEAIARVSLAKWGPMCNYNCSWLAEIPPKDKVLMKKAVARAQAKRDLRILAGRCLLQKQPIAEVLPSDIANILTQAGYSLTDRDAVQDIFSRFQPPEEDSRPQLRINATSGYGSTSASAHYTPSMSSAFPSPNRSPNLSPRSSLLSDEIDGFNDSDSANGKEREEMEKQRRQEEARMEEERRRREMRIRTVVDAILDKTLEKYYSSMEIPSHLETETLTLLLQWGFEQVASSVYCLGKKSARAIPRDPISALKSMITEDSKKVVGVPTPAPSRAQSAGSVASQAGFRVNTEATITEEDAVTDPQYSGRTVSQHSSSDISVHGFNDPRDDDESIVALALASITDIPGFSESAVCKNPSDLFENPQESLAKRAVRPKPAFRLPGDPTTLLSPSPSGFYPQFERQAAFSKDP